MKDVHNLIPPFLQKRWSRTYIPEVLANVGMMLVPWNQSEVDLGDIYRTAWGKSLPDIEVPPTISGTPVYQIVCISPPVCLAINKFYQNRLLRRYQNIATAFLSMQIALRAIFSKEKISQNSPKT